MTDFDYEFYDRYGDTFQGGDDDETMIDLGGGMSVPLSELEDL